MKKKKNVNILTIKKKLSFCLMVFFKKEITHKKKIINNNKKINSRQDNRVVLS